MQCRAREEEKRSEHEARIPALTGKSTRLFGAYLLLADERGTHGSRVRLTARESAASSDSLLPIQTQEPKGGGKETKTSRVTLAHTKESDSNLKARIAGIEERDD